MNFSVLSAVFKRNFISYFANPTGYLFICVFVILSSLAAFWPNAFFNDNLANLDQLSSWFPFIMLIFAPAITMSVWADERRQGTDELLLTIPANDMDVVSGKYLAALSIFSVSLLFSLACNFLVLSSLGDPDKGLFLATYLGYWLIGVAMLAVGMVASFLTANLTIAYIGGVIFNAPLVALIWADTILSRNHAATARPWSIGEQFHDFGQGVISLEGVFYFLLIAVMMLYLSIELISRRHWCSGKSTTPAGWFYLVLHATWGLTFLSSGLVLRHFAPFNQSLAALAAVLAVSYLLLHTLLLWFWSRFPHDEAASAQHYLLPITQWLVLAVFFTAFLFYRETLTTAILAHTLSLLYLATIPIFLVGWMLFPMRVTLLPGHAVVRVAALGVVMIGLCTLFQAHDRRLDLTSEGTASLSPATVKLLADLKITRPVQIDAFISPTVPESYVQSRRNLLNMLHELRVRGGAKVVLQINDTERSTPQATLAEQRFGIASKPVLSTVRGTMSQEQVFMGVAFTCGLQKVILPFIERGIPVEYELVRAINTVTQQKRKRIGVLQTDASLFGSYSMGGASSPRWPIITELEKQFDVTQVDANAADFDLEDVPDELAKAAVPAAPDAKATEKGADTAAKPAEKGNAKPADKPAEKPAPKKEKRRKFDLLLAVQPSSLGPDQMNHFIEAVERGQPVAIFEDPFPCWAEVPGTTAPRRPPAGMEMMMMMGGQNTPKKGDIGNLWKLLHVDFSADHGSLFGGTPGDKVVWQDYNPIRKLEDFKKEFVFIDHACGTDHPFNEESPITSKLQYLLFPFPGYLREADDSKHSGLAFTPLVQTGPWAGTTTVGEINQAMQRAQMGGGGDPDWRHGKPTGVSYVLAAQIQGRTAPVDLPPDEAPPVKGATPAPRVKPDQAKIDVVIVADVDLLTRQFFLIREQGDSPESGLHLDFDNVTFLLNIMDGMVGDERFAEIRKHRPKHRTLTKIDERTKKAREDAAEALESAQRKFESEKRSQDESLQAQVADFRKNSKNMTETEMAQKLSVIGKSLQQRRDESIERCEKELERQRTTIDTKLNSEVRHVQDGYKLRAFFLPPIAPLLIALLVFLTRRQREHEGVARSRLRQ